MDRKNLFVSIPDINQEEEGKTGERLIRVLVGDTTEFYCGLKFKAKVHSNLRPPSSRDYFDPFFERLAQCCGTILFLSLSAS